MWRCPAHEPFQHISVIWVNNLLPGVDENQATDEMYNSDSKSILFHSHPSSVVPCPQHKHPDCLIGTKLIPLQSGVAIPPFFDISKTGREQEVTYNCLCMSCVRNKKAPRMHQTYCACFVQALGKCVHTFRFYSHVKIGCPRHAWWVACCGRKNRLHSHNW